MASAGGQGQQPLTQKAEQQTDGCSDYVWEQVRAMPVPSESVLAELRRLLYPAPLSVPDEQTG
jgi:hypothetical protein